MYNTTRQTIFTSTTTLTTTFHNLQRRQPLTTIRTLQSILHPPLQTRRVEDVPAWRDHVQPPGQHESTGHITSRLARFHDRHFQVLHADRTVESAFPFALRIFVLGERVAATARVRA